MGEKGAIKPVRVYRFALVERKAQMLTEILREHVEKNGGEGERLEFIAELVVLLESAAEPKEGAELCP